MNSVVLIGRLTRDPEIRYISESQMAVATFTVAIDRPVEMSYLGIPHLPFGKADSQTAGLERRGRVL